MFLTSVVCMQPLWIHEPRVYQLNDSDTSHHCPGTHGLCFRLHEHTSYRQTCAHGFPDIDLSRTYRLLISRISIFASLQISAHRYTLHISFS